MAARGEDAYKKKTSREAAFPISILWRSLLPQQVTLALFCCFSLPHCASHCVSLFHTVPIFRCVSFVACLPFIVYLSCYVSFTVCLSLCVSPVCLSQCFFHCVSFTVCLSQCVSPVCLSQCFFHCVSFTVCLSQCVFHCRAIRKLSIS